MLSNVTCIEDLRRITMRRIPRAIFDYVDRAPMPRKPFARTAAIWPRCACASA